MYNIIHLTKRKKLKTILKMKGKLSTRTLIFFVAFFLYGLATAQEKEVSGTVISSNDKMPLIGVSVVVKGTNRGTATDFDGKYSIKVNENETLEFSSVGFQTVQKKITGAGGG